MNASCKRADCSTCSGEIVEVVVSDPIVEPEGGDES